MASYDEVVLPGQVGKVTATLKTDHGRGPQSKVVAVTTDDPDLPTMNVILKANIVGSIQLLPAEVVSILKRPGARPPRALVRQDPTEKGKLEIRDLAPSQPWIKATARRVEAATPSANGLPDALPGDWIIDVATEGEVPFGSRTERVTFKTGLAREPSATLSVYVSNPAPIVVKPTELVLSEPGPNGRGASGVVLAAVPGQATEPLQARAEPGSFLAFVDPAGPQGYRVRVEWSPGSAPAATEGRLILRMGASSSIVPLRVDPERSRATPPPVPPTGS